MRSIVAIALFCTLLNPIARGQDSFFTKKAIYLSFEEFRNNTPSITGHTLKLLETDQYVRSIEYDNDLLDTVKKYRRQVWGFSDDQNMYIKYGGSVGRVIEWGVYCVFTYVRNVEINMVSHEKEPRSFYYVLNYASGEIEEMKANRVRKYLADDKNLAEEYKNEDDKEGQMLEYLRRYNRQHPLIK
jgi:hypothetical protein